jgi:hypothetical protein
LIFLFGEELVEGAGDRALRGRRIHVDWAMGVNDGTLGGNSRCVEWGNRAMKRAFATQRPKANIPPSTFTATRERPSATGLMSPS